MTPEQIAEAGQLPPRTQQMQPDMEVLRSKVTDLESHARTLIRQRPIVALLAAVGVGYVVARLISHGMSSAQ